MAGARVHKIGTIFSRVTGMLRSGAMKEEERPIWYDVYKAFPPKIEPCFTRRVPTDTINEIFYKEDIIRAKFYKEFGSPGVIDMKNETTLSLSQRFVERYQEIESAGNEGNEGNVFNATVASLEAEGVTLASLKPQLTEEAMPDTPYNAPLKIPISEPAKPWEK